MMRWWGVRESTRRLAMAHAAKTFGPEAAARGGCVAPARPFFPRLWLLLDALVWADQPETRGGVCGFGGPRDRVLIFDPRRRRSVLRAPRERFTALLLGTEDPGPHDYLVKRRRYTRYRWLKGDVRRWFIGPVVLTCRSTRPSSTRKWEMSWNSAQRSI